MTVGAQMPFDRLIGWVDDWADRNGRDDVQAQVGPSDYAARRIEILPFMDPQAFRARMTEAAVVVSHAGMGTILTALELGKPILVVPRLGSLQETRNDHQVATAKRLEADGMVLAAYDAEQFAAQMERLEKTSTRDRIGDRASEPLLARLREFVLGEAPS